MKLQWNLAGRLWLCGWLLGAGPALAAPGEGADLASLKGTFESALAQLQQQGRQSAQQLQQRYVNTLTRVENELQDQGRMQAVITAREEKALQDSSLHRLFQIGAQASLGA